jgi:hypothetical protein
MWNISNIVYHITFTEGVRIKFPHCAVLSGKDTRSVELLKMEVNTSWKNGR